MKNEWLGQFFEEVRPKDFYRAVFPRVALRGKDIQKMQSAMEF